MNFKLNKMFIYSCFIRTNNERLKRELEHLGYDVSKLKTGRYCIATSTANSSAVEIDEESFDCSNPHRTWNCSGRIDCGTNEELFLAIAALRDDSDIDQWFVLETNLATINNPEIIKLNYGSFIKCKRDSWFIDLDDNGNPSTVSSRNIPAHKASIDELITYFK